MNYLFSYSSFLIKINSGRTQLSLFISSLLLMLFSCGKADVNVPFEDNGATPGKVEVVGVENASGIATIKYKVPDDRNISYIEAEYEYQGRTTKRKASFYTNEIMLDGFPESKDYTVSLYSVSFAERRSEPVQVTVKPTTPPFMAVAQSMVMDGRPGAIRTLFDNPTGAPLQIKYMEKMSDGSWKELQTIYTSSKGGKVMLRNLQQREYQIGVVCKDSWQNVSDTITTRITPELEAQIPFNQISFFDLPTDMNYEYPKTSHTKLTNHSGVNGTGPISVLFDGKYDGPTVSTQFIFIQNIAQDIPYAGLPASLTVKFNRPYLVTRFVYRVRTSLVSIQPLHTYDGIHPKVFQIWGSNNPSLDGSYNSWNLIGEFESHRPSGNETPGNANSTAEDRLVVQRGEHFDMPDDHDQAYQYYRYRVMRVWGTVNYWGGNELEFFGQPQ